MGRFNYRLLILLAVVLLPVGYVLWQFARPNVVDFDGYKLVDLRWLSDWEMEPTVATDADIPAKQRALDGQRVLMRGEMYRPDAAQGPVKRFQLVYSISKCCVTSRPKIQHFIQSAVMEGKSARAYPDQAVEVMGTLHAGIIRDKDVPSRIISVFRFDVESAKLVTMGWGPVLWIGGSLVVAFLITCVFWLIGSRRRPARNW